MRLPRVRFTVRRMMIAVAVVGTIFGCELTRRRWDTFRTMAAYHADEERRMRLLLSGGFIHEADEEGRRGRMQIGRGLERESVRSRRWYHAIMWAKYERAARYPWLPGDLDPPKP